MPGGVTSVIRLGAEALLKHSSRVSRIRIVAGRLPENGPSIPGAQITCMPGDRLRACTPVLPVSLEAKSTAPGGDPPGALWRQRRSLVGPQLSSGQEPAPHGGAASHCRSGGRAADDPAASRLPGGGQVRQPSRIGQVDYCAAVSLRTARALRTDKSQGPRAAQKGRPAGVLPLSPGKPGCPPGDSAQA